MQAESILKEFRKRRKPLANVNAKNVNLRIKAFVEYCKSVPEIKAIGQNHIERYPPLPLLEGTSNVRPPKAGSLEEIVSIGIYLMEECSEGKPLHTLAAQHGIKIGSKSNYADDYVRTAMNDYISHVLDYLDDHIKQLGEMSNKAEDERANEEQAHAVNEEGKRKHKKLQNAFREFLEKEKGYPANSIEKSPTNVDDSTMINFGLFDLESNMIKALVGFTILNNPNTLGMAATNVHLESSTGLDTYLVCPGFGNSLESFGILRVEENSWGTISKKDFPSYEDLIYRKKGEPEDDGFDVRAKFKEFLINEKAFPNSAISSVVDKIKIKGMIVLNILPIIGEDGKKIALIDFSPDLNNREVSDSNERMSKHLVSKNLESMGYIVCRAKQKTRYGFDIYEVFEHDPPQLIDPADFPTYNQMLFEQPLSGAGRRLNRSLIELASDDYGLNVNATCKDYINLQIKKNKRTALQIHRLNDSDKNLAFVLAGYQEVFPKPKDMLYINRGDISQLSGNINIYPKEMAWLNGNIKQLKYQAEVYIIKPGTLVLPGIKDEVGGLFDLAKNNAGGGIFKTFASKILKVIGVIPTLRSDEVSDVDDLGRDVLIEAFANTLIHTEFKNGFTLALMGNWGEGKSSVMKILMKKLRERGSFWFTFKEKLIKDKASIRWAFIDSLLQNNRTSKFDFALFNAWEYEQTDNLAAGMAQEVVRGLKGDPCGGFLERPIGLRQKTIRLLNIIKGWFIKFCLAICFNIIESRWNLFKLILCMTATWLLSHFFMPQDITFAKNEILEHWQFKTSIGVSGFGVLWYIFKTTKNFLEHPLPSNLERYFKLPNYAKHLGLVPVLKRHIKTLCMLKLNGFKIKIPFKKIVIGKDRKLLLFVDDLDRCESDCIAKTLDAIRLVMPTANVIVMICIDHRIAFKAVEKHYKMLAEEEDGNKRSSAEVARDYLGKIIQIPVRLEPIEHEKLRKYVYGKLFDFKEKEWKQFKDKPNPPEVPGPTTPKVMTGLERDNNAGPNITIDYDNDNDEVVKGEVVSKKDDSKGFGKAIREVWLALSKPYKRPKRGKSKEEKIKDTTEEGRAFYELAGLFEFNNPRQLLRLHNSFRFLKALGRGEDVRPLELLPMLFWQEFLHNWPMKIRGRCMAALLYENEESEHLEEMTSEARKIFGKVKGEISELFKTKPTEYEKMAKFVRVVVLPHNEEGVLDNKQEISDWLTEEKKKEDKKAKAELNKGIK